MDPINHWDFPSFLDDETTTNLKEELSSLFENRKEEFKFFDRNGSAMYEWSKYTKKD